MMAPAMPRHLHVGGAMVMRMVPVGAARGSAGSLISTSYDLPGTIERMTLSAMPFGLQCAPWSGSWCC